MEQAVIHGEQSLGSMADQPAPIYLDATTRRLPGLLSVSGGAISRMIGLALADISTALGVSIPALTFEMVNPAWEVDPDHGFCGGATQPQRVRRDRCRQHCASRSPPPRILP